MNITLVIRNIQYDGGYSSNALCAFTSEELADKFIKNQKLLDFINNPKAHKITEYFTKNISLKNSL